MAKEPLIIWDEATDLSALEERVLAHLANYEPGDPAFIFDSLSSLDPTQDPYTFVLSQEPEFPYVEFDDHGPRIRFPQVRNQVDHTHSTQPLTKRQMRRLKGRKL